MILKTLISLSVLPASGLSWHPSPRFQSHPHSRGDELSINFVMTIIITKTMTTKFRIQSAFIPRGVDGRRASVSMALTIAF